MACTTDTASVALTVNLSSGSLEADLLLSADPNNLAEIHSDGLFVGLVGIAIPTGLITPYASTVAPDGWLLCDGSAVNRSTYASLFALIGTSYGVGDGAATFNLPDIRGRMIAGWAEDGHVDVETVGATDGSTYIHRRPKHNHTYTPTVTDPGHAHGVTGGTNGLAAGGSFGSGSTGYTVTPIAVATATTGITVGGTVGPATGAEPVDTPAYIVLPHLIKT